MEGMANICDDATDGDNAFLTMFGGDESGGSGGSGGRSGGDQGGGNVEDVALKKGPWTTAEDVILMDYVTKNGEGSKIKCLTFGGGGSGRRQVEFTESRFQKKMDRNGIIAIGHCWALRLIQESG